MATTATERDAVRGQITLVSASHLALGLWLLLAPFALAYFTAAARWNDRIVGLAIIVVAIASMARKTTTRALSWVGVALGLWLIMAPFLLDYATTAARWNDIFVGALVVIFALWSGALGRGRTPPAQV